MANLIIGRVLRSASLPGGHTVTIDLELTNKENITLECSHERLPLLASAVNNAGIVAERARKALPGEPVSTVVPHIVAGVRAGTAEGDQYIGMKFQTNLGFPLEIAMTPDLARETIERLTKELENLARRPPIIRS